MRPHLQLLHFDLVLGILSVSLALIVLPSSTFVSVSKSLVHNLVLSGCKGLNGLSYTLLFAEERTFIAELPTLSLLCFVLDLFEDAPADLFLIDVGLCQLECLIALFEVKLDLACW